jgi:hypothetical protein
MPIHIDVVILERGENVVLMARIGEAPPVTEAEQNASEVLKAALKATTRLISDGTCAVVSAEGKSLEDTILAATQAMKGNG